MAIIIATTEKIILTTVHNIFTAKSQSREIEYKNPTTLQNICDIYLPSGNWLVGISGKLFPENQWPTIEVFPGDQVVFTPNLGGPVAAIWAAISSSAMLTFAFKMAISYGIGLLVQSLAPDPDISDTTFKQQNMAQAQFFGWSPQTLQQAGAVIAKFYGDNPLYGNIIHGWTEPSPTGLAQVLNAVIAYGRGPVEGITTGDLGANIFFQNNQPIQNFSDVQYEERYGTLHQSAISLFSDGVKLEARPQVVVSYGSPYTYVIKNDNYDGLDIEISFPQGLYFISGDTIVNHSVGFKIEIAEVGTEVWSTLVEKNAEASHQANYLLSYNNEDTHTGGSPVSISRGTEYKVKLTKTSEEEVSELYGDVLQLNAVRRVYSDGFVYPGLALIGIRVTATDQLSGSFQCSVQQEGRVCEVYSDEDTKSIEYTTDYAWILYNALTSPLISGGSSGEEQDYAALTEEGLVGHWKLDENADTNVFADSSVSGLTGQIIGGWSSTLHTTGEIDGAFDLQGIRYGIVPDNDVLQITSNDFSIAGWVKFNSGYASQFFHAFMGRTDNGSIAHQWAFGYYSATKKLWLYTRDGIASSTTWEPNIDTWYHVAFVRTGTTCIFYVNGLPVGSDYLETIPQPNNPNLYIGFCDQFEKSQPSNLQGCLDDMRMYNRALGVLEVEALHEKKNTLPEEEWEEVVLPYVVRSYRGLPPSKIDLGSFLDFSNYCSQTIKNSAAFGGTEETRFTFNGGFDVHSNRWEAVRKICESSNACPVWNGHDLSIVVEQPRELAQIFNIANIQKSAFRVFFLNQEDRASEVIVEYKSNYDRSQITATDTSKTFRGSATIERMFCNSESMAWRYGAEQILRNRNVKIGLEFEVNIQALSARIGDRVRVAHPVFTKDSQCGGSITQVLGDNSIQIDTPEDDVPEISDTSRIAIRSIDDDGVEKIEMYNVESSSNNIIRIDSVWDTVPTKGDIFILGDTTTFAADYEILKTKRVDDLTTKLTCQQYYEFHEHEVDNLL